MWQNERDGEHLFKEEGTSGVDSLWPETKRNGVNGTDKKPIRTRVGDSVKWIDENGGLSGRVGYGILKALSYTKTTIPKD